MVLEGGTREREEGGWGEVATTKGGHPCRTRGRRRALLGSHGRLCLSMDCRAPTMPRLSLPCGPAGQRAAGCAMDQPNPMPDTSPYSTSLANRRAAPRSTLPRC